MTAYDSLGVVIESDTIAPDRSSNAGDYFGISAAGIASATLTDLGSGDWIFVDNFTFGSPQAAAPEPSTLTLLGIASLCLGGTSWRRRKRAVA